jgi:polyribonucleotide nucleotidyltransferase
MICRLEAQGNQVPESVLKKALYVAQEEVKNNIQLQHDFLSSQKNNLENVSVDNINDITSTNSSPKEFKEIGKQIIQISPELLSIGIEKGYQSAVDFFKLGESDRVKRSHAEGFMRYNIIQSLLADPLLEKESKTLVNAIADSVVLKAFRDAIFQGFRPDGRKMNQIRPINCRPNYLGDKIHGSAYFSRGDTHVICVTTFGSHKDGKPHPRNNKLRQNFFLQYDFPPYCTGKLGNSLITNRRMIGHGTLAEKALMPLIPDFELFPYTIRLNSECTSSSGSSSMASVCGGSLALMDAGVPIRAPAAGISVGLVAETDETGSVDRYVLMTDILGTEDHFGDMVSTCVCIYV